MKMSDQRNFELAAYRKNRYSSWTELGQHDLNAALPKRCRQRPLTEFDSRCSIAARAPPCQQPFENSGSENALAVQSGGEIAAVVIGDLSVKQRAVSLNEGFRDRR